MRTRAVSTILLGLTLVASAGPALAGDPGADPGGTVSPGAADRPALPSDTSDNQPGWLVPEVPRHGRTAAPTRTVLRHVRVAPGITQTTFRRVDARGPVRVHVLRIRWRRAGVRLDYADRGPVRRVSTVRQILAVDRAVAGVNGDFYDIGRTGAPLGMGKDRRRSLLHAAAGVPNAAFYLDARGRPRISDIEARAVMRNHPEIPVAGVNIPRVPPDGIVVYTPRWGQAAGYQVTDGQRSGVYQVSVDARGRVYGGTATLLRDRPITGAVYVGRGAGADLLRTLRRGDAAPPAYGVVGRPRVVITGNKLLALDRVVDPATDDRIMHPRTAVGIDRDRREVLMVVVDGRSRRSRGHTMLEMAQLMVRLGAEDALNLDGGGSSTMVARDRRGRLAVMNRPSDGVERRVANALQVTYHKPRRGR